MDQVENLRLRQARFFQRTDVGGVKPIRRLRQRDRGLDDGFFSRRGPRSLRLVKYLRHHIAALRQLLKTLCVD